MSEKALVVMYITLNLPAICKKTLSLPSAHLSREVTLDVYLPEVLLGNEQLNLLLLNDGQDVARMGMEQLLADLYGRRKIEPVVVVAIHASKERLSEYGVAGKPDFKKRGDRAEFYTRFITDELLGFVEQEMQVSIQGAKVFAGFSLGGLTAFDIAWNNDAFFDKVGVFSGSFWWRKKDLKDHYCDEDRIMHDVIRKTKKRPELKFWLMTGTEDEKSDRNHNFIIDSIDDTIDVIKALLAKGYRRPEDIHYFEKVGGKHEPDTWGKVMPHFLTWAFEKKLA